MKKKTLNTFFVSLAISVSLFSLQSCNKGTTNETEKKVTINNTNMNFDIPVILSSGDNDSIVSFYYKMNMDSFVKSYGSQYDTSSIRSVKLQSCTLILNNGDSMNNISNFHTTNMGITSGTNRNIYRFASFVDIVDTNAYKITIPSSYDPNLAVYFKSDSVRYRLYGNARRGTKKALKCTANISFEVKLVK
jgi:hypothetical protein